MSATAFRVIPVLDVRGGQAVHAIRGIRSHYRPLRSILHPSSDPIELARASRDLLGFHELYLADLDAICGQGLDTCLYSALARLGLNLWIDAGLENEGDLGSLAEGAISSIIVGLETAQGPAALEAMLNRVGAARLVFSLDLFEGRALMPDPTSWDTADPYRIGQSLVSLGTRRLILLDLSRVGTSRGPGTSELLAALREHSPGIEITVGGGVAGIGDVLELRSAGASAVLIGSALHSGRIGPLELGRVGHVRS